MSNLQTFDTRERKGTPAPTGATPAPDKGLAGGAEQAAAANPRVLGPGVRGEAGRSLRQHAAARARARAHRVATRGLT
jgi:hypothetical protein